MIKIVEVGDRKIVVKGIGKLFYQDGFPITMSIEYFKEQNMEASLLHIVDELIKHGWSNKTILNKLRNDAEEGINNEINNTNWDVIETFCNSTYEDQREMLFQYLFGLSTNSLRLIIDFDNKAVAFLNNNYFTYGN